MKFDDLIFETDSAGIIHGIDLSTNRAKYDNDDGVTISIVSGHGTYANAGHPYEVWWWDTETGITPQHEPIGYLTADDVEKFINGKYYNNPDKFIDYLISKT